MKSKYAPYILAPILIIVWGLIFYRVYQAIYGTEEDIILPKKMGYNPVDSTNNTVKFELSLAYNDPFALGTNIGENSEKSNYTSTQFNNNSSPIFPKTVTNPPKTTNQTNPTNKTTVPFPEIVFQGIQAHQNDTVALVKLAGRFYPNIRTGQVIGKFKIISIGIDSIIVQFGEEEKIIRR